MSGRSRGHSGGADQRQRAVRTLSVAVKIACAYVSHNAIDAKALPTFICMLHQAVAAVTHEGRCEEKPKPASPIGKSIQHDYIVCLEDGKKLKMLKRHLRATCNMSPEEYRTRWALPPDYPMVAPAYAAARSAVAKRTGSWPRSAAQDLRARAGPMTARTGQWYVPAHTSLADEARHTRPFQTPA